MGLFDFLGTSTAQQSTTQKSKTNPWGPAIPGLKSIIGGIEGEIPNYKLTDAETGALDILSKNAQAGNPFAPQFTSLTNDLFSGGPDRTGIVNDAYANYQKQAQPYLDPGYLDPTKNPVFAQYTQKLIDDATKATNSRFAAAGRDFSGANMGAVGKAVGEAALPLYFDQYNKNVNTQRGMMDNMFTAGGQTASTMSGLDQTKFGNRMQGMGAAGMSLEANNYGANAVLDAESRRRGLPISNLGDLTSLMLPIAGLGGKTSGTATSTGSQTMSPVQTMLGLGTLAKNFGPSLQGIGSGMKYLGGIFGGA